MKHKKYFLICFIASLFLCTSCTSKDQKKVVVVSDQPQTSVEEEYIPEPVDQKNAGTPTLAIKNLDKQVELYQLGQELTEAQRQANAELKKRIIRGTFDIKELCRLSLGKHWEVLSEAQRKRFVGLMTDLLETKAIFSKEQLQGQNKLYNIRYEREVFDDAEKKTATVYSKMNVPREKMTLDITYKLLITTYGWKIYDVVVDDASLLTNYKFQFDRIITEHGCDELIKRMNDKMKKISTPKT